MNISIPKPDDFYPGVLVFFAPAGVILITCVFSTGPQYDLVNAEATNNFAILGNNEEVARTVTWAKMLWNDHSDQDTAWICEMDLPFEAKKFSADSAIFTPKAEDVWRFNLYRFDRAFNDDPEGEASGLSQTNGGKHEPDKFGDFFTNTTQK